MNLECLDNPVGHVYHDKDTDKYYVSVTSHLKMIAKGYAFEKWLKDKGDDADELRDKAAESGSKIHKICEQLAKGQTVNVEDCAEEEIKKIQGFINWVHDYNVVFKHNEVSLYSERYGCNFAGTIDIIACLHEDDKPDEIVLVDIKTGSSIHDEAWYQTAAYQKMWEEHNGQDTISERAILHLKANTRSGYQYITASSKGRDLDKDFKAYRCAQYLWTMANPDWEYKEPKELPKELKL